MKHWPKRGWRCERCERANREASGSLAAGGVGLSSTWRLAAIDTLGGECYHCGENDPDCLTIDHVHGGGRKDREKWARWQIFKQIADGKREPLKFQVLCLNCHRKKNMREQAERVASGSNAAQGMRNL